jgi:hypothetical protein
MKNYIKLFESFTQEETMEIGKGKLWAHVFEPDLIIHGVYSSLDKAKEADEILRRDVAIENGDDPDEQDVEWGLYNKFLFVDPFNQEESAYLIYCCINSTYSFENKIPSSAIQNPKEIAKKLIMFGVNPFAKSDYYESFQSMEELVNFFDGTLPPEINRRLKTKNLFGI